MSDWITGFISEHGYSALFLLMFVENVFPPIPSELIMPFAGYAAARGDIEPVGAVIAGSAGSLVGALAWYGLGYWLGTERLKYAAQRYGRWLTISESDVDRAQRWLDRYGDVAVCIGRLIPAVRSVISVPAGIARLGLRRFLLWSSVGTLAWSALLTGLGFLLGKRFTEVDAWLQPVSLTIVAIAVGGYFYRLYRTRDRIP
ncbi:MAG TPA: DedA family protein [Burkholderiaceae bacterium]|jgi:membrane protein DedA with SNARE-associated domain|nr:DedA family protein [Burkholderiaceae bacterium]